MVRAPCCEKMGLKKGPWTSEEDQILINYIEKYGHSNWRALPKQAGLLRCGKSCRLRWINYLRPDIKRGNFSREEEDTIIQLHEMLGNRWSAIAARLQGRTDNEIKNVWHTHLKKRLKQNEGTLQTKRHKLDTESKNIEVEAKPVNFSRVESNRRPISPPQSYSSSEISSSITTTTTTTSKSNSNVEKKMKVDSNSSSDEGNFSEMDESFWSEVLSAENCGVLVDDQYDPQQQQQQQLQCNYPLSPLTTMELSYAFTSNDDSDMDFWHNVFTCAGDQLPEFL